MIFFFLLNKNDGKTVERRFVNRTMGEIREVGEIGGNKDDRSCSRSGALEERKKGRKKK